MFFITGPTFGCILSKQFKNLLYGDRFFYTHKENGIKKERGLSKTQRTQIQSRKLSDIMCDNMDIESINKKVFQYKSELMSCSERKKLNLITVQAKGNQAKLIYKHIFEGSVTLNCHTLDSCWFSSVHLTKQ